MGIDIGQAKTLCESCEKACGKCSWSDGSFTPVPGWKAIITPHYTGHSYLVLECPLFKDDTAQYNQPVRRISGIQMGT